MKKQNSKSKRIIRHKRVRAKIFGKAKIPRLSVYRSNKHIFLQLIDDEKKKTILSISDNPKKGKKKSTKSELSYEAGKALAKKAIEAGIKKIVFDRGGYIYKGRIQKVAEGAREGGLNF